MNQRISLHIEFTLDMNRAESKLFPMVPIEIIGGEKKLFSTKTRFIEKLKPAASLCINMESM